MIDGLALSFAVGLFAVVCPGAVPFALALVGLPLRTPLRAALAMGIAFAVVFAVAGVLVELLDLDWLLDVVPWVAVPAGAILFAAGIRAALTGALDDRDVSPAVYGTVFALAALPSILMIFDSLIRQGTEAAGAIAAPGLTIGFAAGCVTGLALPALAASALSSRSQRPATLVARARGALVAAAGIWVVVYWLPALFGGRIERGGGVENAANDAASALTELAARFELGFALLALALAAVALVAAMRPRAG